MTTITATITISTTATTVDVQLIFSNFQNIVDAI